MKTAKDDWIGTQCKEIETYYQQESIPAGEGSNLREAGQVRFLSRTHLGNA